MTAAGGVGAPGVREKRAAQRKWSARAWWVSLHAYNYAALAYSGALSPEVLSMPWFVVVVAVAVVNLGNYVILQLSSPGYVTQAEQRHDDLEEGQDTRAASVEQSTDSDALVAKESEGNQEGHGTMKLARDASGLRFCEFCLVTQPLRTKHCKDCGQCVRQYDHHCDCAGTCVGEKNRRKFVAYLFIQSIEGMLMINVAADAFTLQSSIDEWFQVNWPYVIVWFTTFCALLIAIPLFLYQAYLVSTNQTSWEHARHSAITYLRDLPDEAKSPFDRGVFTNWRIFLCGGDANKWVYSSPPAPAASSPNDTSIM
uniref:Palmitoyltransferase n=1 Tax=Globisporangium ultimum (strain ATCC 200006 / CBS 805.95 / DAOM BR144) TaxID=431595 RepID=K3WZN9_GLOUD